MQSIPVELTGRLAVACAERGHWEALATLLEGSTLPSLGAAPGLLAAVAEAGQYEMAARILHTVCLLPYRFKHLAEVGDEETMRSDSVACLFLLQCGFAHAVRFASVACDNAQVCLEHAATG